MGALLGEEQVLVEMLCQGLAWSQEGHLGPPPLPLGLLSDGPREPGVPGGLAGPEVTSPESRKSETSPFAFFIFTFGGSFAFRKWVLRTVAECFSLRVLL